jgi:hypothetical protein
MSKWAAYIGLALLLASTASASAQQTPPPSLVVETKDRLSPENRRAIIEVPSGLIEAGDLERGQQAFEALLDRIRTERGAESVAAADALSAFGVELYGLQRGAMSLPYLRRAVVAYRSAFGADHPEVALALNDLADVMLQVDPDDASPELLATVQECLRIRTKTLGLGNPETAMTYIVLGKVEGLPARTQGNMARIDGAAASIRRGIHLLSSIPDTGGLASLLAYAELAEVYARNGRGPECVAAVRELTTRAPPRHDAGRVILAARIQKIAQVLEENGARSAARDIRAYEPSLDVDALIPR